MTNQSCTITIQINIIQKEIISMYALLGNVISQCCYNYKNRG